MGVGGRVGHLGDLHDHRPRPIAEQHRHIPPLVVDVEARGVDLGAHHQDPSGEPGADVLIGHRHRIDEPGALLPHIYRRDAGRLEFGL